MSETALPDSFADLARPDLSRHAAEQWDRRMPAAAVAPETALAEGVSVHPAARRLFQTGDHSTPDDVILYRGCASGTVYGAVFPITDEGHSEVAPTVYRVESIYDSGVRAYCWGRLTQESERT